MARDPAIANPPVEPSTAEIGKPNAAPPEDNAGVDREVDRKTWEMRLADGERAEQDWRRRGRDIVAIYRNEGPGTKSPKSSKNAGGQHFNILFANTEVMLPAIYTKPPTPVVRSRFIQARKMIPVPQPPMMGGMPPAMPPGGMAPPLGPPEGLPPGAPPGMPGGMPPPQPQMVELPSIGPKPEDIDTAAAVMEKALEIVVQEEESHEAVKTAIKDVLLPGRGVARVRWKPKLIDTPMVENNQAPPDTPLETQQVKVWETTNIEYVYWEDYLCDPVRQDTDKKWEAFRHLFTAAEMKREFGGTPEFDKIVAAGKLESLLKWTEESAAKSPPSGGGYTKTADKLGSAIRKAMVWEIWDNTDPASPRIIWFMREAGGMDLRIDPDPLGLQGFFSTPKPLLAVSTSDSRIPKPFFDLYSHLAESIETTSVRIEKLIEKIKVRGAYNSASSDIAGLLTADDGKMVPVDGVDMINGGLQNHIWMLPIDIWMQALDKLLMAREAQKQAVYEIMGISDIMRGATKASETATAQRIKGSMGVVRLQDQKTAAANFARDLMRLQSEIIATQFDAETLTAMTGEEVTPPVLAILRSDFFRTCSIDIESDSTVEVDEQTEQQSMAQTMQSIQAVMMGAGQMLQTGVFPPQQIVQLSIELLRMFLHPVRNSRGVIELLDDFKEQLEAAAAMAPPPMLGPPGGAGAGAGSPEGPAGPDSGGPAGAGPRPGTVNQGNGQAPPGLM